MTDKYCLPLQNGAVGEIELCSGRVAFLLFTGVIQASYCSDWRADGMSRAGAHGMEDEEKDGEEFEGEEDE